jgi:hypothetical protein
MLARNGDESKETGQLAERAELQCQEQIQEWEAGRITSERTIA